MLPLISRVFIYGTDNNAIIFSKDSDFILNLLYSFCNHSICCFISSVFTASCLVTISNIRRYILSILAALVILNSWKSIALNLVALFCVTLFSGYTLSLFSFNILFVLNYFHVAHIFCCNFLNHQVKFHFHITIQGHSFRIKYDSCKFIDLRFL